MSMLALGTTEGFFIADNEQAKHVGDGRVNVLRKANGHVLAGTADGVYRSSKGNAWQRMGLAGTEVLEIAAAPGDERLLYAGARPAALFRTTDAGESWTEVESFAHAFDRDVVDGDAGWRPGHSRHGRRPVAASNAVRVNRLRTHWQTGRAARQRAHRGHVLIRRRRSHLALPVAGHEPRVHTSAVHRSPIAARGDRWLRAERQAVHHPSPARRRRRPAVPVH